MTLKFDAKTLAKWNASSVESVSVRFVKGGCAGVKIEIETEKSPSWPENHENVSGIAVHFHSEERSKLENATITGVEKNGKPVWIYSGPSVKNRCGCGSSFGFDENSPVRPSLHGALKLDASAIAKAKERLSAAKN